MRSLSLRLFQDAELLPMALCCLCAVLVLWLVFRYAPIRWREDQKPEKKQEHLPWFHGTRKASKWTKKDWWYVSVLTVCYAIVSFWQLGSTKFPSTTWQPSTTPQSVVLELTEDTHFDTIYAIYGEGDNNSNLDTYQLGFHDLQISGSEDGNHWEDITVLSDGSIYQYKLITGDWNYRYIRITSVNKNDTLTEIGFKAAGEKKFLPVAVKEDEGGTMEYPATLLIDEQDKLALDPIYLNESYFDEVYHPRNAWEIANGEYMYATVHPLLGTCLIALSIKLFGMNPLAWRIPGVLFGIFLIPLFYGILKRLFQKEKVAGAGALMLACDFMHLATSRIATLEPFSVFWILLMYRFMIDYCYTNYYDSSLKDSLKTLLKCGIAMGIGIATKWTACYSAIGLAVLLFMALGVRVHESHCAVKALAGDASKYSAEELELLQKMAGNGKTYFWKTIAWCFLFFIGIPIVIYWVSYLPCKVWRDGWSISNVWSQCEYMYHYHINLKATHPYQSTWYQWLFDIRPIWYFGRMDAEGMYHSISCFSNPLLTWAGFPAILYVIKRALKDRDRNAWIIAAGYLSAFLPWVTLVKRCVFAYHFYPTSFFMILAIAYCIERIWKKNNSSLNLWVCIFLIAVAVLFVMFLPATAGFGTTTAYIKFLEWFPSWYFG